MCELPVRGLRALVALALVTASVHGQQQVPVGELDSARAAVRRAYASYVRALAIDSLRQRQVAQLTRIRQADGDVKHTGFVVRADSTWIPRQFIATIDTALAMALRDARQLFGNATGRLLDSVNVTITPTTYWKRTRGHITDGVRGAVIAVDGPHLGRREEFPLEGSRPHDMISFLEFELQARASSVVPPAIVKWMRRESIVERWNDDDRSNAYRTLALFGAPVGLACLNGAPGACRNALGLPMDGDTIAAWFDAPTRLAMAQSDLKPNMYHPNLRPGAREACLKNDDLACREVLSNVFVRSPTSSATRAQVLRYALLQGGPAAFQRLIAAKSDDVAEQLAIASGIPFDSLVAVWRADVLAGQPASPLPTVTELASMLVGCAVLVGLVAWRRI